MGTGLADSWREREHRCVRCGFTGIASQFNPFRIRIENETVTLFTCPECEALKTVRLPVEEKE